MRLLTEQTRPKNRQSPQNRSQTTCMGIAWSPSPPPSPSHLPFPTNLPPPSTASSPFPLPLPFSTPSILLIDCTPGPDLLGPSPSPHPMGAGASKPPIPATHPAGVAFRRKLEEIRRRRKVRAFRDSIVSTTELLKDRADLESVGDVARLSAVGFEADSAEPAKDTAGATKDDEPSGEKKDAAAKEEAAAATTATASEPAGNVAAEVKADTKEAAEIIDEKKEAAETVVTKKVEITEAVTSLAAEVALLKIEEDGEEEEEEEEEEEKDGSELAAGDLPGSPSFRYFAMLNNQAGDSDDSDHNQEAAAGHGKDDDEEDAQDTKEVLIKNIDGQGGVEGEKLLSRKKKRRKMMVRIRARSLARGPVAMCTLLNVNACYSAPQDSPNAPRRRTSIRHIFLDQSNKDKVANTVEDRKSTSEKDAAGEKPPTEEVTTNEKPATNSSSVQVSEVA